MKRGAGCAECGGTGFRLLDAMPSGTAAGVCQTCGGTADASRLRNQTAHPTHVKRLADDLRERLTRDSQP